jgi:prolipoprotein diacylglyceryltransferase
MFLILYGFYRFIFDFLREGDRILGLRVGQYTGLLAVVVGISWLFLSMKNISSGRALEEDVS